MQISVISESFACPCRNPLHQLKCFYNITEHNFQLAFPLTESYSRWDRLKLLISYIRGIRTPFWDEIILAPFASRKILQMLMYDYIKGSLLPIFITNTNDIHYRVKFKLNPENRNIILIPQFNIKLPWYYKLYNGLKYLCSWNSHPWIQISLEKESLSQFAEFLSQSSKLV